MVALGRGTDCLFAAFAFICLLNYGSTTLCILGLFIAVMWNSVTIYFYENCIEVAICWCRIILDNVSKHVLISKKQKSQINKPVQCIWEAPIQWYGAALLAVSILKDVFCAWMIMLFWRRLTQNFLLHIGKQHRFTVYIFVCSFTFPVFRHINAASAVGYSFSVT